MNKHESINYIEIPAKDLAKAEAFFSKVFDWRFEYFGNEYMAFYDKNINGGFFLSPLSSQCRNGSTLVIFYSDALEDSKAKVLLHGGVITQDTFDFPGGRRFHFEDTNQNEFAVWSNS